MKIKSSRLTSEPKLRYRAYKSKKRWMYAALSTVGVLGGAVGALGMGVQAEPVLAEGTTIPTQRVNLLGGGLNSNRVAVDPDSHRSAFESSLNTNPASPTSVTVATPVQVLNDSAY